MDHGRATIDKKRRLSRGIATTAGAVIVSTLFAVPAHADEPANEGCIGTTMSALAGPRFGQGVRSFAQADGPAGLGDGIQQMQAGLVPDNIVWNTCNDQ